MNKLLSTVFAGAVMSMVTLSTQAQEIKGDAKAGEGKIAMCIGCHGIPGYQASFPEVYRVPKISGQGEKYIASALSAYKKGERRHATMRGIAETLSEQDIADVAAYYAKHGVVEGKSLPDTPALAPSAQVADLLGKGNCTSCHGANFSKPLDPSYPKLAGQNADYLFVALKSYASEHTTTWGRSNAIMGGMVKPFSSAELKALASYIGHLDGELKTLPQSRFR